MLMNKRLRTILQYIFFLGLGIFLVWWSIRDLNKEDRSEIRLALNHARYWLIIPVFCILLISHYVRALRWKLLMEPLGYKPSDINSFFAVLIGYLANLAFPRLGEVLKCSVLTRYEKIPMDKLIGTVILERIIDALTLIIIFAITLAIQPGLYSQLIDTFFNSGIESTEKKISGTVVLLIIIGIIILAVIMWMMIKKKRPNDLLIIFKRIALRIWEGISAIQHLRKRRQFILLTILLWVLYLSGGYIGFFALRETEHFGIKEAFTILSAGSVGVILTPGGIGAYAYLIEKTMYLYGLPKGIALAFGWILWLVQTAVIIIGGFFSFAIIPWYNKRRIIETN